MSHPTLTAIYDEMVNLATEFPDGVYLRPEGNHCFYNAGEIVSGPADHGCIVGQAARKAGVNTSHWDNDEQSVTGSTSAFELLPDEFAAYDPEDSELIRKIGRVQVKQDSGLSWSVAIIPSEVDA